MHNVIATGVVVSPGDFVGQNRQAFRYWSPIGGTGTAKATITRGHVCVPDIRQRGAYNDGTGARAAVGGAPNYAASIIGSEGSNFNVTVVNDQGTPAPATRVPHVAVLDQDSVDSGAEGIFVVGGMIRARLAGAANAGDRLSLDVTNNTNAGFFKVAAANETVYAICRQTIGAAGLALVELVPPSQATTAGNA